MKKKPLTSLIHRLSTKKEDAFQNYSLEELVAEDGRLVNLIHRLPIAELADRLLPLQENWQDSLLDDLSLHTELPYKSLFDFLKEQEELQGTFQTLEQIPAPIITIATPTKGGDADFVAVAAATSWANEALHRTEITIEYLSSHLGASFGLGTTGGLGTSTGIGTTTGIGATAGAGAGAAVAAAAGPSAGLGLNLGAGGSLALGGSATLGVPITLNDIVTNGFNTLRTRFWRVNTAGGNALKTISPILVTVGNPDQNPQTARLNDQLPVYFDGNETGDGWSLMHRRNGQRFEGHVGIISLSSVVDGPDFSDGMIGLDMVTILMAGTDNQGMSATAKILQTGEDSDYSEEMRLLLNYMRGLITRGMNIDDRLDRLRHFTNLSKTTWSKSENPFLSLPKQIFEHSRERIHNRAQESHVGQALQRLSTKIDLKEKVDSSWVAKAVLKPDLLQGAAFTAENTGITNDDDILATKSNREFLLSNPAGISLIIIADDDGEPQSIEIMTN